MRVRLVVALLVALGSAIDAQEFRGSVRDSSGAPLREAQVTLVDTALRVAGMVRTDVRGEFRIRTPGPGYYGLQIRRLGYVPHATNWLELEEGDAFAIDVVLRPAPVTLSAVTVRAQRDSLSRRTVFGLNLRSIGGSLITPAEIESRAAGARNIVDVIAAVGPPWISSTDTPDGPCVSTRRGGAGGGPCLLVLVDDVRIDPPASLGDVVTIDAVDHVVLLRASEAGVLFGTGAHNGVLLVYTRTGRARR
jgi:hypothetical protein